MVLFDIFKKKKKTINQKNSIYTFDNPHPQNSTIKDLWDNGSEQQWQNALNTYYYMLHPKQREIEAYFDKVDVDVIKRLDEHEFYDFLYNKYFVWKYTAKNRLATTRKNLEKYIINGELSTLKNIHSRIFSISKDNIGKCIETACEIRGLGTAGASGLMAILFPNQFGTVDQFVVKRLQEIDHPIHKEALYNMNPERLKIKDAIILIQIMREKATELNIRFHTDFWTPRKIDMILWSFNR